MRRWIPGILLLLIFLAFPATGRARDDLKNTDPEKYYIYLDTGSQVVTVYEKDDDGAYTRIVRRMLCTSGRTRIDPAIPEDMGTPTPAGSWKIGARERFGKFASFNNEYARYWTQIVDGVYFHSIMFGERSIDKLKKSAFGHLGNDGSHGCVRLYVEDAKWLYYHACPGTTITVGSRFQGAVPDAVRTDMSFSAYDAFQKNIYDVPEQPDLRAWVVTDAATLRTGNGSNDSVILHLSAGDELEVLQEGDPWIKAAVHGREGYVKRAYITYVQGELESSPEGKYLRSTAYLYAEPSRKAERVCKVPHDVSLIILPDQTDVPKGWTRIRYWTEIGYVESRQIATGWATLYENDMMPVSITKDILGE